MKQNFPQICKIVIDSIILVGRHYYLYFIPLIFFLIASIVFPIVGIMGLTFITSVTFGALLGAQSESQVVVVMMSGCVFVCLFLFVLIGGFLTGFVGGMGQMLKGLLTTNRISISEFATGMFRHGPRLLLGLAAFSILFSLPFIWGLARLQDMYSVYDFATMDSGWNYNLRESIGQAHSGIVFWTYIIQIIIAYVLSLWWVISISETRHFTSSFMKSIVFVFRNPVTSIVVIAGCIVALVVATFIFSTLFGLMGLTYGLGGLIGLYLLLPIVFIIILQFYDPRYIQVEQPEVEIVNVLD